MALPNDDGNVAQQRHSEPRRKTNQSRLPDPVKSSMEPVVIVVVEIIFVLWQVVVGNLVYDNWHTDHGTRQE